MRVVIETFVKLSSVSGNGGDMSSNDLVDGMWQPLNAAAAASRQMVECLASREIDDED